MRNRHGLEKQVTRKRVLFFGEAVTLAHIARPVVLAQALVPDDYDVFFACDPRFRALFPDLPIEQRAITSITSEQFGAALAKGSPMFDVTALRNYVEEDLQVIEEVNPDVVIGDFRLSLAVSTAVASRPYMTITNAYWSPYAKQRYPVPEIPLVKLFGVRIAQILFNIVRPFAFAWHALPLNRVRREYGLPGLGNDVRCAHAFADYTLYADIPEMVPTVRLPDSHHFLGPVLWSPPVPTPAWWSALPVDRPIIYLTMGSSGKTELLPIVLAALAEMPVTVICATARRITLNAPPENVFIADYLPGDLAVDRADLVICNGGSPATQQALVQGVAVLGIASNLDQYLNMESVQRSGAGELLRSEHADQRTAREAAERILANNLYAQAAKRAAGLFSRYDAADRFRALVAEAIIST